MLNFIRISTRYDTLCLRIHLHYDFSQIQPFESKLLRLCFWLRNYQYFILETLKDCLCYIVHFLVSGLVDRKKKRKLRRKKWEGNLCDFECMVKVVIIHFASVIHRDGLKKLWKNVFVVVKFVLKKPVEHVYQQRNLKREMYG